MYEHDYSGRQNIRTRRAPVVRLRSSRFSNVSDHGRPITVDGETLQSCPEPCGGSRDSLRVYLGASGQSPTTQGGGI